MIKLCVEKYCEECEDFIPVARTFTLTRASGDKNVKQIETTVHCKYEDRCHGIAKYLKMKKENWGNKE